MSKPRYYWYGSVRKMVMRYEELQGEDSIQAVIHRNAIEKALEETRNLPNGEDRIKAITELYFKQQKTLEGVALSMNYSWRTVQNWTTSFINLVGRYAGF